MSKSLLEDLWLSYEIEKHTERIDEERKIAKELDIHETRLREDLTKEEKLLLEKVLNCMGDIHTVYENQAFVCGIRFGVRFLLEAMEKRV